jgi:tripartite-type tricarboxylate transporter receptor subunit TctC
MKPFSLSLALILSMGLAAEADTISIHVGYAPGGSFDLVSRLVADHLGAFLPGNPEVIVENVPGAGSLKVAKMLMADPATDGMVLGSVNPALALLPVLEPENTDFDPTKAHYIATMSQESSYCITPKSTGIKTFDQFLQSGAKVGATGKASSTYSYPAAIKSAFGANIEIVTGFEGSAEIDLAMERGDLQGRCGITAANLVEADMLTRYTVLGEIGTTPSTVGPKTEFILDKVSDPATKAALTLIFSAADIHHPFIVAPATSPERVAELRAAFDAMVADPGFQEDAKTRGYLLGYRPGAEVDAVIAGLLATDPAIKDLAHQMVQ